LKLLYAEKLYTKHKLNFNSPRNSRKLRENLWDYSEMNDVNHLRSLLEKEKGLDINSKLIDDWTALHLAANEGHSEIIEILSQYKANLEAETKMERRAIHIAALRGNLKVIQILVKNGAQINPRVTTLLIYNNLNLRAMYITF
jgi:ankyrin repeat protein